MKCNYVIKDNRDGLFEYLWCNRMKGHKGLHKAHFTDYDVLFNDNEVVE